MNLSPKSEWLAWLTIGLMIILSVIWYPQFPAQIPSHWNIYGEIDGWTSPLGHILLFNLLTIGLYGLFSAIPLLEPRREHLQQSFGFLNLIKNFTLLFFFILFLTISWGAITGQMPAIDILISAMLGLFFIAIGKTLSQVKSTFLMGIRTPWTLSSDTVWQKTHRLGGYGFIGAGLIFVVSIFLPEPWNAILPLASIFAVVFIPVVYSYVLFVEEKRSK